MLVLHFMAKFAGDPVVHRVPVGPQVAQVWAGPGGGAARHQTRPQPFRLRPGQQT